MDSTAFSSTHWIAVLRNVAQKVPEPTAAVMGGGLAEALGVTGQMGTALWSGMEVLVECAQREMAAGQHATDIEAATISAAMRAIRPMLEARLQQQLDQLDAATHGETECTSCKVTCKSEGQRERPWRSLVGELRLRRRYASCPDCGEGRALSQERLGLSWSDYTPRFEEVATMMATTVPHGMAVDLLSKAVGVEVSAHGIQQMTERRGQSLQAHLEKEAKQYSPYQPNGLPVEKQQRPPDSTRKVPEVAYLEIDGVVPMTRERLTGSEIAEADRRRERRAKRTKARGGKGRRYRLVGREVKNAVLYQAESCIRESSRRRCITDKSYVSLLGDWQQFAQLLWVAMLRAGFDRAKRLIVLSDGSDWIRSVCSWLPIPTLLILDLFHVKHRIWEVANALHGEHSPKARTWAEAQCQRVEAGEASSVIQALGFLKPRSAKTRELVEDLAQYLRNNLDRIDYPAYVKMGYRIGSGAVESANYHVTGARLKLQGMRWSEQGAREMAHLRADLFNGNWEARTRASRAA